MRQSEFLAAVHAAKHFSKSAVQWRREAKNATGAYHSKCLYEAEKAQAEAWFFLRWAQQMLDAAEAKQAA